MRVTSQRLSEELHRPALAQTEETIFGEGLGRSRRRALVPLLGKGGYLPPLGRARENGGSRPAPRRRQPRARRLRPARPPRPARPLLLLRAGEGRGRSAAPRSTPRPSARFRRVRPRPCGPLQAAPARQPLRRRYRAPCFPSGPLCPGARRRKRGNARRAVRLRRRADGAPCRESGMGTAPGRPALSPPPSRHFVLRRARTPRDGCPETRTTKARAPGLRGLQVLPLPAGRRWRSETAAVPEQGGKWMLLPLSVGVRATHGLVCAPSVVCTFPCLLNLWSLHSRSMPELVFAPSGMHEPVGFHALLCVRPRECART